MSVYYYTVVALNPHEVRVGDSFVGMADRRVARVRQHNARWYFHDGHGRLIRTCAIGARVQVFRPEDRDYCDPQGITRPVLN